MKKQIKIIGNTVITPFGSFVSGDLATLDANYADHLIEWAEIRTSDDTVLRKYFKAGETPVVEFPIPFDQVVFARAYCNKHGAWRAK